MKKICVIGLGYIGLPTSVIFAKHGFQVHGVDVNEIVVKKIANKELYIEEPGLQEALEEAIDSGHFTVSTKPETADVFIVAVPSPITKDKKANLDFVRQATKDITPYVRKGNLVILESTVPPRTVEDVMLPILKESGLEIGEELYVAHSPERVIPGKILTELIKNNRIVGGINRVSGELTKELYSSFVKGEIHITDATTAEMVKVMENTYRDLNIAFANELAKLSLKAGVNIWEAIQLANNHPRVNIHYPGPGVGGHCIAVDPWFLADLDPENARMIALARETNDQMPQFTVDRIKTIMKEHKLASPKLALLGLSFKGNVDDMRESPSLSVMELLNKEGIEYRIFDPYIKEQRVPHQTMSLEDTVLGSDIIVVLTDHKYFKEIDPKTLKNWINSPIIYDTRNCINEETWEKAGFSFYRLGDAKTR
ncbi:MAG: nucleotide sugar dehydrogenase [Bacillaceae bacterium]|nr:nucleotide sugar dehydrogenase [Bacillaceae bacterium]